MAAISNIFRLEGYYGLATREVLISLIDTVDAEGCNPEKFFKNALDLLAKDKSVDPFMLFKLAKA